MKALPKPDDLRASAVRVQPEIAAVMSQVQQRRVQLHRQPSGLAPAPRSAPTSAPPAAAPAPPAAAPAPRSAAAPAPPAPYRRLPSKLRDSGLYCLWRYEPRPNSPKPAKVPYNPRTGEKASVADPSTFTSFEVALQHLTPQYNGIGVLVANDLGAIDLDDAIDANGNPTPEAADIIRRMGCCYTEISPSGRGYRLLFTVRSEFHFDSSLYHINNRERHMEVYLPDATNKYVTVTGNVVQQRELLDRTEQLQGVLDTYMRRPAPAPQPAPAISAGSPQDRQQILQPEDRTLIEGILHSGSGELFEKLYAGDLSAYGGDWSRADLAFCNMLAARTQDVAQIDRIVRSSGLFRSKWDEPRSGSTYGLVTIGKALASAPERPQQATPVPQQAAPAPQQATQVASVDQAVPAAQAAPATPQQGQPHPATQMPKQPGELISASELMRLSLPDIRFHVDELLPEGITLLAAAPKLGKSFLGALLALTITTGTEFLGHATTPSGVLYLALEDNCQRLQKRIRTILAGLTPPDNLFLATEAPDMQHNFFGKLDEYLFQHPCIRLILVDTLQMIRGLGSGNQETYSYSADYSDLAALKKYGETRKVSIFIIHHTRKMSDSDIFSTVSGTQGIAGAVDSTWILARQRNAEEATLSITGRDVVEQELAIVFDKPTLRWTSKGDARVLREKRAREDFFNDPLVKTIFSSINAVGTWEGTSSDVAAAGKRMGHDLGSPQQVGLKLNSIADKIRIYTDIRYSPKPNGTGGRIHSFAIVPQTMRPLSDNE